MRLIYITRKNPKPKVIWEEPHRRTSRRQSHLLQWKVPNFPLSNLPLPLRPSPPESNTPIQSSTPITTWTWLYHQKDNEIWILTTYCPYGNIANFSHTSRIHFSTNNTSFRPFKRMGCKCWILVAKTTSGFNSDRTIRQYARGLLLESPFVPSSTDRWAVRAKIRQRSDVWGAWECYYGKAPHP